MKILTAKSAKNRKVPRSFLCAILCVILCVLCGLFFSARAQSNEFSLNSDSTIHWQFRKAGDTKWYDATVPGCVHTDLLDNKLIPDPFYRDNESKVQWVENEDWEYQTFFDCGKDFLSEKHLELHFDGLDTYADVYLNDSLILRADNMFRSWNVDVTGIVTRTSVRDENEKRLESRATDSGANHLFIHFYSAVKKGKELAAQPDYKLPGDEGGKAFERKAQYQFGWDWGPRLVTCGVWKDVKLVGWDEYIIDNFSFAIDSETTDTAYAEAAMNFRGSFKLKSWLSISAMSSDSSFWVDVDNPIDTSLRKNFKAHFKIAHPKKWWSNNQGEQKLTEVLALLLYDDGNGTLESCCNIAYDFHFNLGLKKIDLVQQPDSLGSSFYFQLNGQPLFIKGANIIPPDNFLSRVYFKDYRRFVDDAVACHMNMLRVWGGGVYFSDEFYDCDTFYDCDQFYDYCDRKGILVWQDFMFAGAMVPGDSAFAENVKQEAIDQVIRLRNHPCIALWCGNNEINEAWNNWGFQDENKSKPGVNEKTWNDYKRIFDTILPQVVHDYDPGRAYIESSPMFGWGHKESLQKGDSHYWGVWWGEEPFSSYETHVGRFMSEYGFQSLPSMDCFYEFASPDDWKKIPLDKTSASDVLNLHEKHPRGYELIHEYMQRDYKVPTDFEKYVYVSQLLQRDGMAVAIEAHRRAKAPDGSGCMGTMYWQLNDCWPVTSWSSEDYYGKWKALQYALKDDLYKTFLISMKEENDSVSVYVVSDSSKDFNVRLRVRLLSFDGEEKISVLDSIVHLPANSSVLLFKIPVTTLRTVSSLRTNSSSYLLHAELSLDEETIASKNFFLTKPKDLALPNPNLQNEIHYSRIKSLYEDYPNVYLLTLHTEAFAKDVFLSYDFEDVKFSDNFFDMLPGEEKTVIMFAKEAIDDVHLPVKVMSLRDTY